MLSATSRHNVPRMKMSAGGHDSALRVSTFQSESIVSFNVARKRAWSLLSYEIRYRIFIVVSKADSSQLNLQHCTTTEKIITRNSETKRKISEVPEADKKPWSQFWGKRKESIAGMIWEKIGFKLGVKERGSCGWWKRRWNTSSGNDGCHVTFITIEWGSIA